VVAGVVVEAGREAGGEHVTPGLVRIVGAPPTEDESLAPGDLRVEVSQADGTWVPLACAVSITVEMNAYSMVMATIVVEPSAVELVNMLGFMRLAERPSWWKRLLYKIRSRAS
jgi:hypothetical protein